VVVRGNTRHNSTLVGHGRRREVCNETRLEACLAPTDHVGRGHVPSARDVKHQQQQSCGGNQSVIAREANRVETRKQLRSLIRDLHRALEGVVVARDIRHNGPLVGLISIKQI
jgi:hypothetical protein